MHQQFQMKLCWRTRLAKFCDYWVVELSFASVPLPQFSFAFFRFLFGFSLIAAAAFIAVFEKRTEMSVEKTGGLGCYVSLSHSLAEQTLFSMQRLLSPKYDKCASIVTIKYLIYAYENSAKKTYPVSEDGS